MPGPASSLLPLECVEFFARAPGCGSLPSPERRKPRCLATVRMSETALESRAGIESPEDLGEAEELAGQIEGIGFSVAWMIRFKPRSPQERRWLKVLGTLN